MAFEAVLDDHINRKPKGRKRLGDSNSIGAALDPSDDKVPTWTGTIYMGRFTPMDVVFDTGSDWLMIESHLCDDCPGNTYDISGSEQVGPRISERVYGESILRGVEHKDTVCILLSACVYEFEFFAIYSQKEGMAEPIDGILGLARSNKFYYAPGVKPGETHGPLYANAMYSQGLIDQRTVSFYYNGKVGTSYVDFGTPQVSAMSNARDIRWIEMEKDFFWSAYNSGVGIGSTDYSNTFAYASKGERHYPKTIKDNSVYTIFDTGLSAIMLSGGYAEGVI